MFYCARIKRNICFTILLHIDDHNIYGGTLYGVVSTQDTSISYCRHHVNPKISHSFLFFKETDKTLFAYSLRAPGQKGISIKTWGTLVGSMMLRSIDRAMNVYQSMMLRGFKGVMPLQSQKYDYKLSKLTFGIMCILLLFLKGVTL